MTTGPREVGGGWSGRTGGIRSNLVELGESISLREERV